MGRLEPGVEARLEPVDDDPSITQLVVARPRSLGYLGDPELTARRFVTDEQGVRWWRSGDVVAVDNDGVFHHHGRADELVKIHGVFVAPSRLDEELRKVAGIGAAAAVPTTTRSGQVVLVAHVQVDDDTLTPQSVEKDLRSRLPTHLMPAMLVRHEVFPRTDRQKVDRRALGEAPLVRWRSVPARVSYMDLERWCLGEVRRIVGIDDVGPDDDLFESGLDSLSALELCSAFADAGFPGVDPSTLIDARTCTRLCATVHQLQPLGSSTVVTLNGQGTRHPLVVLPGGGGTALKFRFLAEFLGADRPVLVIEARGMHRPGRVDRSIGAFADHALEEIDARLGDDDPCLLVGYSASGPVAYEVAQRMYANGRRVHLLLLDAAPSRGGYGGMLDLIVDSVEADPAPRPASIRTASLTDLPAAVKRSLRYRRRKVRLWWFEHHPGAPTYSQDRYLGFMRILGKASRRYKPVPAPFPATLIHVGNEGLVVRAKELIPDLSVILVGGDHHTMLEMPEVVNLAAEMTAWSDAVSTETPVTTP